MIVLFVTLAATFSIQLGHFLWKIAADELPRIGKAPKPVVIRAFISSRKWMVGTALTIVGWLFFVKATDLGDVSIVQPLMSVGDLFLVLLAVIFLHERLGKIEWIGLLFTVAGAVSLAFDVTVIGRAAIDWPNLGIFVAINLGIWAALYVVEHKRPRGEVLLAIAVGIGFGLGAAFTKLMTSYLAINGRNLESSDFVLNPILPFMIAANVVGLLLLQLAFQHGRASVVIPVQLAVANGLVVLAGSLVFAEKIGLLRMVGIGLIIGGTAILELGRRAHASKR